MFPKVAAPKMILTFFDMLRVVYTRQLRGRGKKESGELMKNVLWWTRCLSSADFRGKKFLQKKYQ